MKKIGFIFSIVLFFSISFQINAQWFWQNPLPTGNPLNAVSFSDSVHGTAVGDFGTIIKTTDGGENWVVQSSGTLADLLGVSFIDAENGYIVGGYGIILKTTDGGLSWNFQTSGTTHSLLDVSFKDVNNGIAVGTYGEILKTTNGGQNWSTRISGTSHDLNSVCFIDNNTLISVGQIGTILRTTDGGENWESQSYGASSELHGISFIDANYGFVVGYSTILKTTDGGVSWISLTGASNYPLYSVSFIDTANGFIAGLGKMLITTNGGIDWTVLDKPNFDFNSVIYLNKDNGIMVGSQYSYTGTRSVILKTKDKGLNWVDKTSGTSNTIFGISFSDENNGTAVGSSGTIILTTNGGNLWVSQISGINATLNDVYFIDVNNGTAVGDSGIIVRTTDGGLNWQSQSSGIANSLLGVFFADINNGIVVGRYGTILRTTNSGQNWYSQTSGTNNSLEAVSFTNSNTGIIVGWNGTILKTTDGGQNWYTQPSGTGYDLYDVLFIDDDHGIAVGGYCMQFPKSVIMATTDGGSSWSTRLYASNDCLHSVSFCDLNNGIAEGEAGIMYKTVNGGITWSQIPRITYNDLYSSSRMNANTITIAGAFGTILSKTDETLPVELTSFTAYTSNSKIQLYWSTATELNNHGFEIERSLDKTSWATIGFREGNGTTLEPQDYSYSDDISEISSSKLYYRLKQIDFNGTFEYSNTIEVEIGSPNKFSLSQNYPNPFNPNTSIQYAISNRQFVTLKVYDVLGKEIAILVNEEKSAGSFETKFNASHLASGIYYYQLRAGDYVETKKMILLK